MNWVLVLAMYGLLIFGVFMIQTWGYSAPTYRVFRKHVDKAILAE